MTTTPEQRITSIGNPRAHSHDLLRVTKKFEHLNGYPIGHGHVDTLPLTDHATSSAERHIDDTTPPSATAEEIAVSIEHVLKPVSPETQVNRIRSRALGARALAGRFIESIGSPRLSKQQARHLGSASMNLLRPTGGTHKSEPGKHRRQIGKHRT